MRIIINRYDGRRTRAVWFRIGRGFAENWNSLICYWRRMTVRICSRLKLLYSDSRCVDEWVKRDVNRLEGPRVVFQYADVRWGRGSESIGLWQNSFGHMVEVVRPSR